ncbi:acetyltransferase [Streptomyces tauricus]|uniref:Lysine N-acyltransferase MbtK n=1 Tax=Streptomyces tauricus TaxID=68274 RepID=A0ABZ1JH84_9ACTN|nr:GNAT family N-acetyltransferase [Streptomyces tauricus]
MPPPDASTDAAADADTTPHARTRGEPGPAAGSPRCPDSPGSPDSADRADSADTLDLRLPDELLALFARNAAEAAGTVDAAGAAQVVGARYAASATEHSEPSGGEHRARQADDRPPDDSQPADGEPGSGKSAGGERRLGRPLTPTGEDLLDRVGDWGQTATVVGAFHLIPVRLDRDLPLISRWMNDPAVAAFWELSGPDTATEGHLRAQLAGDGRSVPCLGMLDGTPMSYWEIYRADLDPLARHYPARLHDTGIHLLIGGVAHRGRGLGTTLLRAVSDLILDRRPSCARVVAEPDLRNTPSVSAFLGAGFRFSAEVDLPDKKAALMVRDRALRGLL